MLYKSTLLILALSSSVVLAQTKQEPWSEPSAKWELWKGAAETGTNGRPCATIVSVYCEQDIRLYNNCGRSNTNQTALVEISGGDLTDKKSWKVNWTPLQTGGNSRVKTIVLADTENSAILFQEFVETMDIGNSLTISYEDASGRKTELTYTLNLFTESYAMSCSAK